MATHADPRVDAVRRFNRLYTRRIGALRADLLDTPFCSPRPLLYGSRIASVPPRPSSRATSASTRVTSPACCAASAPRLISRERSRFDAGGACSASPPRAAGRSRRSTPAPAPRSARCFGSSRTPGSAAWSRRCGTSSGCSAPRPKAEVAYLLRPHQPGDIGWVVHRHAVLYAQEYRWDKRFESLVAKIVAKFVDGFDPQRERCSIAERDGEIRRLVFLVTKSPTVAQLRMLYVEPAARGLRHGQAARGGMRARRAEKGYRKIVLSTNSIVHAARRIYEAAATAWFAEEPHHSFGHRLVGQTWERS